MGWSFYLSATELLIRLHVLHCLKMRCAFGVGLALEFEGRAEPGIKVVHIAGEFRSLDMFAAEKIFVRKQAAEFEVPDPQSTDGRASACRFWGPSGWPVALACVYRLIRRLERRGERRSLLPMRCK
jgi:hypothetical protein